MPIRIVSKVHLRVALYAGGQNRQRPCPKELFLFLLQPEEQYGLGAIWIISANSPNFTTTIRAYTGRVPLEHKGGKRGSLVDGWICCGHAGRLQLRTKLATACFASDQDVQLSRVALPVEPAQQCHRQGVRGLAACQVVRRMAISADRLCSQANRLMMLFELRL